MQRVSTDYQLCGLSSHGPHPRERWCVRVVTSEILEVPGTWDQARSSWRMRQRDIKAGTSKEGLAAAQPPSSPTGFLCLSEQPPCGRLQLAGSILK